MVTSTLKSVLCCRGPEGPLAEVRAEAWGLSLIDPAAIRHSGRRGCRLVPELVLPSVV